MNNSISLSATDSLKGSGEEFEKVGHEAGERTFVRLGKEEKGEDLQVRKREKRRAEDRREGLSQKRRLKTGRKTRRTRHRAGRVQKGS